MQLLVKEHCHIFKFRWFFCHSIFFPVLFASLRREQATPLNYSVFVVLLFALLGSKGLSAQPHFAVLYFIRNKWIFLNFPSSSTVKNYITLRYITLYYTAFTTCWFSVVHSECWTIFILMSVSIFFLPDVSLLLDRSSVGHEFPRHLNIHSS